MDNIVAGTSPSAMNVVQCSVEIAAGVEAVWSVIGQFGEAGRFLNVQCALVIGTGEIGSVRRVGDAILEVMVGKSLHSYTYAQTKGPMAVYGYHGCIALSALGGSRTRLNCTLVFQSGDMTSSQVDAAHSRLSDRFQGAIEEMRKQVEAGGATNI